MKRLAAAACVTLGLLFPAPAQAQDTSLACNFQLATAGGQALTCPLGGIRNVVDIEGGTEHYENGVLDRGKLRLNLSGGEAGGVREAIALNPDLGGCTRIYDGRRYQLASLCPLHFPDGGIRFYEPPQLCDPDCAPLSRQTVARRQVASARLRLRVGRLERRVARLRAAVRRLALTPR